ncbi:iron-siderophore ABC transporter substrate-binding protein [Cellulomonas fimi]|uniref:Periplasmic binding protein n=1 Tax=Cellulomonas fimi (strain ATCC 484 / DSM 20113 / JCM 1341 / CCUG 24087 / LMG 16345 / NBRC 15513 / NCIMB 8980 / NCTC 7547 / NRS-133) TaxID=590998 RepID=F4H0H4_CELFA|nr:iron-siderophore ABC transporter substrate-binding protein [Cellulomonas fimi]AEE47343.1 periplasmic binding protein [Cellulomonas fimi ATCC 484]VEH35985.1 Putative ABC transporter substrate-binding lipoprotein yhfQ precursor [Cellulomonas fimi]
MRHLRRTAVAASVAVLALALAACSGSTDDDATAEPGSTASDGTTFPVTIESALGTAVVEEKPERVVTLGWGADDITLSLGTVPVGVEADTWGGDADGYHPWFREAVEERDGELPETIAAYPLDVDAIVALEPDLVLAPQSGMEQDVFDQLSEIVPVVAYPEEPWQTTIEQQVEIIATALGVPEQAEPLLDARQQAIDEAAAAHPELAGISFAYVYAAEPGSMSVYLPGDPRVDLLSDLGLELAPSVAGLEPAPNTFTANLGLENADTLSDVELLFTWFNDDAEKAATEAQPLFAQIPAFASGAYVPMLDRSLGMAVSVATPLSVPWALDAYLPLITAGAEKA